VTKGRNPEYRGSRTSRLLQFGHNFLDHLLRADLEQASVTFTEVAARLQAVAAASLQMWRRVVWVAVPPSLGYNSFGCLTLKIKRHYEPSKRREVLAQRPSVTATPKCATARSAARCRQRHSATCSDQNTAQNHTGPGTGSEIRRPAAMQWRDTALGWRADAAPRRTTSQNRHSPPDSAKSDRANDREVRFNSFGGRSFCLFTKASWPTL
jgi:hypothetical protein